MIEAKSRDAIIYVILINDNNFRCNISNTIYKTEVVK